MLPGGVLVRIRWSHRHGLGSIPRQGNLFSGEGDGKPTPVFLPGKSYGQRSLVGYSPKGS